MSKQLNEKPKLPKKIKNELNQFAEQVNPEFTGFISPHTIKLTKDHYARIINFFTKPENRDNYCRLEDKFHFESPEGDIISEDNKWGVDLFAAIVHTMKEVPAEKRTKQNDWWKFPSKEASNRKAGIPEDWNQYFKGTVTAKAAPSNIIATWLSPNQLAELDYDETYIFIGIRQIQWSRKNPAFKNGYENANSEEDAKEKEKDGMGQFYENHSLSLVDFLE